MQPRCTLIHAVAVVAAAAAAALLLPPLAAGQPWPTCDTSRRHVQGRGAPTSPTSVTSPPRSARTPPPRRRRSSPRATAAARPTPFTASSSAAATSASPTASTAAPASSPTSAASAAAATAAPRTWPSCTTSATPRFSNKGDFLAATDNAGGETLLISGTNITGGAGVVAAYDRAVTELLAATVRYAVEENPARLFATGQRVGDDARDPGFRNIYSMAQCSPDLPPASCRRCLDGVLARWWQVFPLNGEGARVAGARCYLRSELGVGPFYTGAPMVVLRADKV
ncbi:hypothetical protein OsJ_14263 [Oryza sativa Japonica Group]|uniref:Gnk2-homologous domain-containing protein n=1 Tax=Oryza sativa subsp. japonica TaxID=39947 RepID=A3ASB7_ORYSJ|nr:hypothetical protein OsJ_14263 [Oryza sativa Japonica Group]